MPRAGPVSCCPATRCVCTAAADSQCTAPAKRALLALRCATSLMPRCMNLMQMTACSYSQPAAATLWLVVSVKQSNTPSTQTHSAGTVSPACKHHHKACSTAPACCTHTKSPRRQLLPSQSRTPSHGPLEAHSPSAPNMSTSISVHRMQKVGSPKQSVLRAWRNKLCCTIFVPTPPP
jgi:hypothetical protein